MASALASTPRFAGKTCLVTGGGRGVGRAIALALAREGGEVGVFARTASQCELVASEIGDSAMALQGDVTHALSCERAVVALTDRFGPPTVIVNAAGISPVRQRAEVHDVEAFREILDVNLTGVCST